MKRQRQRERETESWKERERSRKRREAERERERGREGGRETEAERVAWSARHGAMVTDALFCVCDFTFPAAPQPPQNGDSQRHQARKPALGQNRGNQGESPQLSDLDFSGRSYLQHTVSIICLTSLAACDTRWQTLV